MTHGEAVFGSAIEGAIKIGLRLLHRRGALDKGELNIGDLGNNIIKAKPELLMRLECPLATRSPPGFRWLRRTKIALEVNQSASSIRKEVGGELQFSGLPTE
jgi:hypothetical protein